MLVPVKTRKIEAIDRPITAQNAQNTACAVDAEIVVDAEGEEEDESQRREHHHPFQRRGEDRHVKRGRVADDEGDDARHDQAEAHVVVDAQHVLAQTLVEQSGARRLSGGVQPKSGGVVNSCQCSSWVW